MGNEFKPSIFKQYAFEILLTWRALRCFVFGHEYYPFLILGGVDRRLVVCSKCLKCRRSTKE